jgi:hypothetical protein
MQIIETRTVGGSNTDLHDTSFIDAGNAYESS